MDNGRPYVSTKPLDTGMFMDTKTICLVTLSSVLSVALLGVICCILRIKLSKKRRRRPPSNRQTFADGERLTNRMNNMSHQQLHYFPERASVVPYQVDRRQNRLESHTPNIFIIPRPRYEPNTYQTWSDGSSASRLCSGDEDRRVFYPGKTSVINPMYGEEDDASSHIIPSFLLRDLYVVTERSSTKTICNKQVVSICHEVDYLGDHLILDNMGISLKVPRGAVRRGERKRIALLLNWDLSDNPNMENTESLVSPVVYVGPHNLKLEKPCVLTFRHCAFDTRQIKVLRSETDIDSAKDWKAMCENDGRSDSCYLTADECQLTIDSFTLYTCIQTPHEDNPGKKWLQIAVFACPLRRNRNHHQIRVYFLNKTNCALQWAIQREQEFGGKLVCPEHVFLFDGKDHDMLTITKYISEGWEVLDHGQDKEPFLNIWHGKCPFVPICYKKTGPVEGSGIRHVAIEMSLCIETYQETLESSSHKIIAQVYEDDVTPECPHSPAACQHPDIFIQINNSGKTNTSGYQSNVVSRPPSIPPGSNQLDRNRIRIEINNDSARNSAADSITCPRKVIPYQVRKDLILLLDPKMSVCGQDWRDLATALDKADNIDYLDGKDSPTAELLNIVESRNMSLNGLRNILVNIERLDCVKVIDDYLKLQRRDASEHCMDDDDEYDRGGNLETRESSWTQSVYVGNESKILNVRGPASRTHSVQNDYYDRDRSKSKTVYNSNNL